MIVLPLMLLIGVTVGLHWGCSLLPGGLYGYMLLLLLANFAAWTFGFRVGWQRLKPL